MSTYPYQGVAQKYSVSGKGNLTIPLSMYSKKEGWQYIFFVIVYQDHKADNSLKSLTYTATDAYGYIVLSDKYSVLQTSYMDNFPTNDRSNYFLKIDYEYVAGRQEIMEARVYGYK